MAPKLDVQGFEELRFAPGWDDPANEAFWSLVMAWRVEADSLFTMNELEKNLEAYFDGLMKPNHWAQNFPEPIVEFGSGDSPDQNLSVKGQLDLFDGFYTGKVITLNILAQQKFCESHQELIIVFRFSPQVIEHPIWEELRSISLKGEPCN